MLSLDMQLGVTNEAKQDTRGQIGLIGNEGGIEYNGFEISPGYSRTLLLKGVQADGVYSSADEARGIQLTGGVSRARRAKGIQGSGVYGIAQWVQGLQFSGGVSNAERADGLQVSGGVSYAEEANGVQGSGVVSVASRLLRGFQFAPICYAKDGHFLQVGIITIRDSGPRALRVTPLIGYRRR